MTELERAVQTSLDDVSTIDAMVSVALSRCPGAIGADDLPAGDIRDHFRDLLHMGWVRTDPSGPSLAEGVDTHLVTETPCFLGIC